MSEEVAAHSTRLRDVVPPASDSWELNSRYIVEFLHAVEQGTGGRVSCGSFMHARR